MSADPGSAQRVTTAPAPPTPADGISYNPATNVTDAGPRPMSATTTKQGAPREAQRRWARTSAVEIPTMLLLLLCYGGWLAITYAYGSLPLWIIAPIGAVLLTLHSSLQHEI